MCKIFLVLIAVLVTVYQTYRGFRFQWFFGIRIPPLQLAQWQPPEPLIGQLPPMLYIPNVPVQPESIPNKVILLCMAEAFTYFVCASSGFVALFKFLQLLSGNATASSGNGVLMVFLLLYGITGITGKLPDLLGKMKLG